MPKYKYEPKIRNPLVQPPTIAFDGAIIYPGDTIELTEEQAGWTPFVNYIEDGWIELACPDGKCKIEPKKEEPKEEAKEPVKKTTRKTTKKSTDADA